MRAAVSVCLLLLLTTGCATSVAPHQYLDEETAATVTTAAKPWIFTVIDRGNPLDGHGYLNLYAFDVNRAGTHQRYLAAMQSSYDVTLPDEKSSPPTLELQSGDHKLVFQSTPLDLHQLGIARPLAKPVATQTRWWYFVVTREDFAAIAQLQSPHATLIAKYLRFDYVEFQSGSEALMELASTLQ